MSSPIEAISALSPISSVLGTGAVNGVTDASATSATAATSATSGADFASVLGKGIDSLNSAQSKADGLAVSAATGDLTDISQYSIAATQASLMTELATSLRTKGVDAFNQIMGMQA